MSELHIELSARDTMIAETLVEYVNKTVYSERMAGVDRVLIKSLATGTYSQQQAVRSYARVITDAAQAMVKHADMPERYRGVGPYSARIRHALAALYAYSVVKHATGQNVDVVA